MSTPTKSPMRTCAHCGHLVPSSQAVCIYCGKDKAGVPIQPAIIKPQKPTTGVDRHTLGIILIVGGVALALILAWAMPGILVLYFIAGVVWAMAKSYQQQEIDRRIQQASVKPVHVQIKTTTRPKPQQDDDFDDDYADDNPILVDISKTDGHPMRGTMKQIKWAKSLRHRMKIKIEAALAEDITPQQKQRITKAMKVVLDMEEAEAWIDTRDTSINALVKMVEDDTLEDYLMTARLGG